MESRFRIECRDVAFGYEPGRSVVDVESMTIPPGKITVFWGGNGTGKTTFMKLIAGLLIPWEGEISLSRLTSDGGSGTVLSPREVRLASIYVHQEPYIMKGSVKQNLSLLLQGVDRPEKEVRISEALAMTGLGGFEKRRAAGLSGGEKKRLALSRALAAGRRILLLDEPTANVDAAASGRLKEHLSGFRDKGMTVIMATHDRDLADHCADLVYDFSKGGAVNGTA